MTTAFLIKPIILFKEINVNFDKCTNKYWNGDKILKGSSENALQSMAYYKHMQFNGQLTDLNSHSISSSLKGQSLCPSHVFPKCKHICEVFLQWNIFLQFFFHCILIHHYLVDSPIVHCIHMTMVYNKQKCI